MFPRSLLFAVIAVLSNQISSPNGQVLTGQVELLNDVAIKHHWVGSDVADVSPVNWSWTVQQFVYDPAVPGVYSPIGTSFGFTLSDITSADIGRTWRLEASHAAAFGFEWVRFADWALNPLPYVQADFGLVAGMVAGMERVESAAGSAQTRHPEYNFISYSWPGGRHLRVDRLEFTLEDFSKHTTNQPFSLAPGTQLRMRVELYGVRTVPEPSSILIMGWALIAAAAARKRANRLLLFQAEPRLRQARTGEMTACH